MSITGILKDVTAKFSGLAKEYHDEVPPGEKPDKPQGEQHGADDHIPHRFRH